MSEQRDDESYEQWLERRMGELAAEAEALRARLAEADRLIAELCAHEGAEGWSEDLRKDLDAYFAADSAEPDCTCGSVSYQLFAGADTNCPRHGLSPDSASVEGEK